jgi:hypothetical protein
LTPAEIGFLTIMTACRCAHAVPDRRLARQQGSALIVAVLAVLLLTAFTLALVLTTSTEVTIAANFRAGRQALHGADAALERAMQDAATLHDWNAVLARHATSGFIDGPPVGQRAVPGGATIDLAEVVNLANCGKRSGCSTADMDASTTERPWGANNPRWQLYGYGPVNGLLPASVLNSPLYVVVMVGDDSSENDNDPETDGLSQGNPGSGVVTLRAEAFGAAGTHRVIEATVARAVAAGAEGGYSGQRGQDEQNRRARDAAVQTPGTVLTHSEMSVALGGTIVP